MKTVAGNPEPRRSYSEFFGKMVLIIPKAGTYIFIKGLPYLLGLLWTQ